MRTVEADHGDEALEQRGSSALQPCSSMSAFPYERYEVFRTLRGEFGDDLPIIFTSGDRVDPLDRTVGLMLGADTTS